MTRDGWRTNSEFSRDSLQLSANVERENSQDILNYVNKQYPRWGDVDHRQVRKTDKPDTGVQYHRTWRRLGEEARPFQKGRLQPRKYRPVACNRYPWYIGLGKNTKEVNARWNTRYNVYWNLTKKWVQHKVDAQTVGARRGRSAQ